MRTIKESSDELNPTVVTHAYVARAPRVRTARDYLALAIATCGVGYLRVAPGTWGSAVGVGIYVLLRASSGAVFEYAGARGWSVVSLEALRTTFELLLVVAVTIVGVWASTRAESLLARKDPGAVVIDEVAGQLITFLFVPFNSGAWAVAAGFVAFRVFDIWKPYPIRRLEALESGLGIMADDVLAGAYAATLLSLLIALSMLL
ncbi:MAG TPA: phosphatidylglycerophosphatase A [Pyrinomonadaceae bacterium]|jgi:phosphatidylglycerophosphatase A|nr:phosphatidylglycerophosphatase A [Pyrinomonadaceae bacterium]